MHSTYKNTLKLFVCDCISGLIFSCGNNKKAENSVAQFEESTEKINEVVQNEFKYPIPTSFQISQLLQDANAAFILAITNPVENVDKYETQRAKALNLGIYGADLSYASTYNRKEETLELLKASKSLIDGLQISNVFTQSMANKIEENVENKDSLISIISHSFYRTYAQLNQNGQDKLALLVVAGSWIEGLYITTQLAISSNYDDRIMKIVADQKITANKLAELCEKYKDDADVNSILPLIRFMNLVYDGVIEGASISKGQLLDILDNVEATRNDIVG